MVREEEKEEIQVYIQVFNVLTLHYHFGASNDDDGRNFLPKNYVHNGVTRKNKIYCPHIPVKGRRVTLFL